MSRENYHLRFGKNNNNNNNFKLPFNDYSKSRSVKTMGGQNEHKLVH